MQSSKIPREVIQEILETADIVEIVSGHVALKKAGSNYRGLCPFHNEKTPSFNVNPSKRIFKCFGCGEGGDVIQFKMKIENKSFPAVVKELAEHMGIIWDVAEQGHIAQTLQLHKLAETFFNRQLEQNSFAMEYLLKRGLDKQVIAKFALGYAPDSWDALLNFTRTEMGFFDRDLFSESGLFSSNERGKVFDRFRQRVIFPIHNHRNQVIAFGGRVLNDSDKTAKYLNSPDSPLFEKGRVLYNLNRVAANDRVREVIVVEGYMDVIALDQFGINNVVAPLGTGFTKQQVTLLEERFDKVVLLFDGDNAGSTATLRALERLIDSSLVVLAVRLDEGMDPMDVVRTHGSDMLRNKLCEASNALRFYCEDVLRQHPVSDRKNKKMAYVTIRDFFRKLDPVLLVGDDRINEPSLVHYLSTSFDVQEQIIRDQFFPARQSVTKVPQKLPRRQRHSEDLLRLILSAFVDLEIRKAVISVLTRSEIEPTPYLVLWNLLVGQEVPNIQELPLHVNSEMRQLLTDLDWEETEFLYSNIQECEIALTEYKFQQVQQKLVEVMQNLADPALGADKKRVLQEERMSLTRERGRLIGLKAGR